MEEQGEDGGSGGIEDVGGGIEFGGDVEGVGGEEVDDDGGEGECCQRQEWKVMVELMKKENATPTLEIEAFIEESHETEKVGEKKVLTPTPAVRTRLGCSGRPMVAVSTS